VAAVASTAASPLLGQAPCETILVGDLADLERAARETRAELLVTHSHGRQAAERLGIPLFRVGFPIFDRLGSQHRVSVGYAGTRSLIFDLANVFLGELREARPRDVGKMGTREGFPNPPAMGSDGQSPSSPDARMAPAPAPALVVSSAQVADAGV
jgi:nitrogenase molybdenum-iron protein NifN